MKTKSPRTPGWWRREAADRHCEMLRETLRLLLTVGPRQHPAMVEHAEQVLAATTRRERDLIGTQR
mgnify:FL=1